MKLHLDPDLLPFFSGTDPLFDQIMRLNGKLFRNQNGRRTFRIFLGHKSYFIKVHSGIGWKEIWKNLFQWRTPITSAKTEYLAIKKLNSLNVPVPRVVGYGWRGINPAKKKSFILMEELSPTVSLETLGESWLLQNHSCSFKRGLIKEVATLARTMHEFGINHRDFYVCHLLLDLKTAFKHNHSKLYLIDVHRAQIRHKVPFRWLLKDLIGLYFSSKNFNLTKRDLFRFICEYRGKPLRTIWNAEKLFWKKIKTQGESTW